MRLMLPVVVTALAAAILPARAADLPPKELAAAKKLYQAKCARCHKFYEPSAYDDDAWNSWMLKMRKKARLKGDQYELLWRYTERLRNDAKKIHKPSVAQTESFP